MQRSLISVGIVLLIGGMGVWYSSQQASHAVGVVSRSRDVQGTSTTPSASLVDSNTFTDDSLGFSFVIPPGFHAQKTLDDSGETVLVQSADESHGFQVYITPFTDPASSVTKARIQSEAKLTVANDSSITVAGAAQGLQFDSTADTPPTRQVWFVYNGYLYQASTWASDANLLQTILASWHFNS